MNKFLIGLILFLFVILVGMVAFIVMQQSKAAEIASWTATPTRTPNLSATQLSRTRIALYTPPPTWTPTTSPSAVPTSTRRASSTPLKSPTIDPAIKTSVANSAQAALQQMGDPLSGMEFQYINCQRIDAQAVVRITGTLKNNSTVGSGAVSIRGFIYDKTGRQVNTDVGKTLVDRVDAGALVNYQVQVADPRNLFSICRVEFEQVPLQQTFTPMVTPKATLTPTPATGTITVAPTR